MNTTNKLKLKTKSRSSDTKIIDISPRQSRKAELEDDDEFEKPRPKRKADAVHARSVEVLKRRKPDMVLPKKLKKKDAPTFALTVPADPARISKLVKGQNRSILGDSVEEIHQLLERSSNESAVSLIQKKILQTVLDAIPLAENTIRETEGARGVYQLNSLITSLREIIIDMQSTQDKGTIAIMLVEKVIRPMFLEMATVLIKESAMVSNVVTSTCGPNNAARINRAAEESLVRISGSLQAKYEEVKMNTEAFLKQ